jgi:hypothetical protein
VREIAMSVAGFFEKPKLELVKKGTEEERLARVRDVEAYRSVEDYDPVLRAHCGVKAGEHSNRVKLR